MRLTSQHWLQVISFMTMLGALGFFLYSGQDSPDLSSAAAIIGLALSAGFSLGLLVTDISRTGGRHRLINHYRKHSRAFDRGWDWTVLHYAKDAKRLVRWHRARTLTRTTNETVHYNQYTREFAVTAGGTLRTYFIPRQANPVAPPVSLVTAPIWRSSKLRMTDEERMAARSFLIERAVLSEIVAGYPCTEDDYTNDLVLRDMIEDIAESLSEPSRAALREVVDPWDEEFKIVTRETTRPLYYLFGTVLDVAKPGRWWWDRAPLVVDPAQGWDLERHADTGGGRSTGNGRGAKSPPTATLK
jgi:hypothetical protein